LATVVPNAQVFIVGIYAALMGERTPGRAIAAIPFAFLGLLLLAPVVDPFAGALNVSAGSNPALGVLVGGRVFVERPDLVALVGADATASDARQAALQADYQRELGAHYGIRFNQLYVLANMPIQRFGSTLVSKGTFGAYMALLRGAHRDANLDSVMCRDLVSVDWQGWLYDCDFNQMLGLPMRAGGRSRSHLRELSSTPLAGLPIVVRDHCYGCTAGQGSSCGGALAA
jgi:hypothetical protein